MNEKTTNDEYNCTINVSKISASEDTIIFRADIFFKGNYLHGGALFESYEAAKSWGERFIKGHKMSHTKRSAT